LPISPRSIKTIVELAVLDKVLLCCWSYGSIEYETGSTYYQLDGAKKNDFETAIEQNSAFAATDVND
jgi:hypothetical protein